MIHCFFSAADFGIHGGSLYKKKKIKKSVFFLYRGPALAQDRKITFYVFITFSSDGVTFVQETLYKIFSSPGKVMILLLVSFLHLLLAQARRAEPLSTRV